MCHVHQKRRRTLFVLRGAAGATTILAIIAIIANFAQIGSFVIDLFGALRSMFQTPSVQVTTNLPAPVPTRETDAIYQDGKIVARVSGIVIDESNARILFAEIYNSNSLALESEFEFRGWRLKFHSANTVIFLDVTQADKGRIIEQAVCEIIGAKMP